MSGENLVWHPGKLTPAEREAKLGQKGAVVWFTGLSGSGKSSLARAVEWTLVQKGKNAFVLDGDNVRLGLNSDLQFSPEDRSENIRRIGEVAKLLAEANVLCLSAFISPYRADRAFVRGLLPPDAFVEVHCAATVAQCEARDVKGLYKKARDGKIADFTGISAPYEAPEKPELVLQTGGQQSLEDCVRKVIACLEGRGIL